MTTTTDLSPERLDELERKYKPNYPAVYIDNKTARSLIAMARAKQAAERERDALREFVEDVARAWPKPGTVNPVTAPSVRLLARDAEGLLRALAQPTTEGGE